MINCKNNSFYQKFPPSEPCACEVCQYFCNRPGWWLVVEARDAIGCGYAHRMMLEISPEFSFGVLSPAFKGNEGIVALQINSRNGCTFLENSRCALFNESFEPAECRFCHHERIGQGKICHREIERDWNTSKGKRLVRQWCEIVNIDITLPGIRSMSDERILNLVNGKI
jgi:hypothetical protein